jgi:hypothetical protein
MSDTEHYEIITDLLIVLILLLVLAAIELFTFLAKDFTPTPEEKKQ